MKPVQVLIVTAVIMRQTAALWYLCRYCRYYDVNSGVLESMPSLSLL